MKCPECGKNIESTENRCLNCGYELSYSEIAKRLKDGMINYNKTEIKITNIKQDDNKIANILKIVGYLYIIIGFIISIIMGVVFESFLILLCSYVSCLLFSLFNFAISEIIQILHDIRHKLWKK